MCIDVWKRDAWKCYMLKVVSRRVNRCDTSVRKEVAVKRCSEVAKGCVCEKVVCDRVACAKELCVTELCV